MRTIKFRGKRLDNGEWIVGDLVNTTGGKVEIHWLKACNKDDLAPWWAIVIPETVGQFTGLLDNNGKEIYEGDILSKTLHPQIYYGDGRDSYNIHHGLICRCEVIYNNLQTSFELKTIYLSETGVMVGSKFKTEIAIGDRYPLSSIDGYTPQCQFTICGNIHDNPELIK